MSAATPITLAVASKANFEIIDDEEKGKQAVFDTVIALRAARRSGSACAKTRAEIRGTGKKAWKQKGTGRARVGDKKAPHWRGGGVAHGPRPRDYSIKLNKRVRRLAFRKALSARIILGDVLACSSPKIDNGKTRDLVSWLHQQTDSKKVLIIDKNFDEMTKRASRNIPKTKLASAKDVTVEDLLNYDKILFVDTAWEDLSKRAAK